MPPRCTWAGILLCFWQQGCLVAFHILHTNLYLIKLNLHMFSSTANNTKIEYKMGDERARSAAGGGPHWAVQEIGPAGTPPFFVLLADRWQVGANGYLAGGKTSRTPTNCIVYRFEDVLLHSRL